MKKTTWLVGAGLAAAAAVWSYQTSTAQPDANAPLKVAVVNVAKVLTECQENLDREKEIREREQAFNTKLNDLKAEADSIRQELETALKPGSPEHLQQMQKYFDKMALYESYKKGQPEVIRAETQAWMEALYQKLLEAVAEMSRLEGISLVLNKDELPDVATMIRNRRVIYSTPSMDITARIMENMDRAYSRQKATLTTPTTP